LIPVGILQILKKPEVLAFFAVYLLIQAAHAPYYVFYSIYLKTHHYSATLTGLLWALGVVAEIVLFIYAKRLLKRSTLRTILLVSLVLSIVRWLVIARYVDSLAALIVAQLLHAATFGGTHIAAIHLVDLYFGRQHQGKGQALYGSLSFGLGGMLGSLFSGYYWQSLGSEFVYSMAALCCSVALLIAYIGIGRKNNNVRLKVKNA
jgi:PPP family 3-phenylpropionic acid transporter